MAFFAKIVNGFKALSIFAKSFILIVSKSAEYASFFEISTKKYKRLCLKVEPEKVKQQSIKQNLFLNLKNRERLFLNLAKFLKNVNDFIFSKIVGNCSLQSYWKKKFFHLQF